MEKTLLIIDTEDNNWYNIYEQLQSNELDLRIEQTQWPNMTLTSYGGSTLVADLYPPNKPIPGSGQDKRRMIQPDFVLIRNFAYSMYPHDHRNQLFGFMHGNIPAINSFQSFYMCLHRPVIHGALQQIQKKLGKEQFPLIEQIYYSNWNQMIMAPSFPIVVKVGHVHAGVGKMRLQKSEDFHDFGTIMAVNNDYSTAEHFYDVEYDIRLLKIGDHYRAHRRYSLEWKKNRGGVETEDIKVNSIYKKWLDEVSTIFGGLDMFALDAIHTTNGEEIILEVNASAMGLNPYHKEEDMKNIADLVINRMKELFLTS